ncbi:MAG: hypothetical protein VW963_03350 [Candidatus Neomarinimicrobiota bacterium]
MKKNLIKLLVSLSLVSNLSYADTTGNLVSQDFTTGWTNTGNTYHGSSTIAGVNNGTVESDSVSLNSLDINKESLNEGFTVTGGADIWFWNSYSQSVTQTIKTVDDNGNTLTQTRVINGIQNGYQTYTDQLIINSNSQQDYDVNLKYSFSVPGTSGHYGADLKNPYLSVTYTYVPPLDSATQTALFDLNEDIKEDLKFDDFKFEEEVKIEEWSTLELQTDTEEMTFQETFTEMPEFETNESLPELKEEDKQEVLDTNSFTETSEPSDEKTDAPLSSVEDSQDLPEPQSEEQEPSLQAEQSLNEESDTEKETSTEEEQTTEAVADNKGNVSGEKKSISLAKSMEKIDAEVKDIGKNLQLKNLVKIKIMSDNDALLNYANIPFYQPKNIYLDQANIRDNRILYNNVTLVSYQQKDPIFQSQKELFEIRQEKQKLIRELQILKNG